MAKKIKSYSNSLEINNLIVKEKLEQSELERLTELIKEKRSQKYNLHFEEIRPLLGNTRPLLYLFYKHKLEAEKNPIVEDLNNLALLSSRDVASILAIEQPNVVRYAEKIGGFRTGVGWMFEYNNVMAFCGKYITNLSDIKIKRKAWQWLYNYDSLRLENGYLVAKKLNPYLYWRIIDIYGDYHRLLKEFNYVEKLGEM